MSGVVFNGAFVVALNCLFGLKGIWSSEVLVTLDVLKHWVTTSLRAGTTRESLWWFTKELVLGSQYVWFPAKLFMFWKLDPAYYGLWCNIVSFCWSILLAMKTT